MTSTNEYVDGIAQCAEESGYDSVEDMFDQAVIDSIVPAWCPDCKTVHKMEPDQAHGYCENCGGNDVTSILVLCDIL